MNDFIHTAGTLMKTFAIYCLTFAIVASVSLALSAADEKTHKGVYYGPEHGTEYQKEKCQLDIYLPPVQSCLLYTSPSPRD